MNPNNTTAKVELVTSVQRNGVWAKVEANNEDFRVTLRVPQLSQFSPAENATDFRFEGTTIVMSLKPT